MTGSWTRWHPLSYGLHVILVHWQQMTFQTKTVAKCLSAQGTIQSLNIAVFIRASFPYHGRRWQPAITKTLTVFPVWNRNLTFWNKGHSWHSWISAKVVNESSLRLIEASSCVRSFVPDWESFHYRPRPFHSMLSRSDKPQNLSGGVAVVKMILEEVVEVGANLGSPHFLDWTNTYVYHQLPVILPVQQCHYH